MTALAPADEAELAEAVAGAAASSQPLEIVGGGTRLTLGRPVQAEASLGVAGLSGITLYEPAALTLVVKAGTPMAEIEETLAAEGQMLPFEPMDHRPLLASDGAPTIGGAVAVAACGPRRFQRGACRDAMIGVRFVDGTGRIVANGGRVMKNVTGFDLVKMMAGSWGTLGVISEIAFKLLPAPRAEATLILRDQDAEAGLQTLTEIVATPHEVTGAAFAEPGLFGDTSLTALRLEGLPEQVRHRTARLCETIGWEVLEAEASRDLWRQIRDVTPFADRPGAVWRLSMAPSEAMHLSRRLDVAGFDHTALYDWAGGLVWLLCDDTGDAGAVEMRRQTADCGHATLVRAPAAVRAAVDVFQPEPATLARFSAGLRAKFDPKGILNPGRMGA